MGAADDLTTAPARQHNPRGQGHRLRDEIIAGATQLIERTGSEHSITLRAVAREIGIAAPSIAPHFADRAEIIDAVVATELDAFTKALHDAASGVTDPVEAILAACRAYVALGRAHPKPLPAPLRTPLPGDLGRRAASDARDRARHEPHHRAGVGLVQGCIDAGRSASTDAFGDILAIWMLLHGLVALPTSITSLPWPDTDRTLTESVALLARIQPAPRRRTKARGQR